MTSQQILNPFKGMNVNKKNKSELDLLRYELQEYSSDDYNGNSDEQPEFTALDEPGQPPESESLITITEKPEQPTKPAQEKSFPYQWMFLALLAHTGWGIYPALSRYLQTVSKLPSMSLLITGNGVVALVTSVFVVKRGKFFAILKIKLLPVMVVVTCIRTATNLISPKFTNAIYVQLMTLMAPFLVALFNTLFMKEDLPPRTVPAMLSAFVGALLMLFSNIFPFKFAITPLDFVGIALAFISACFLAFYMILIKKAMVDNTIGGEEILFFLAAPVVIVGIVFTFLLEEDWSPWRDLTTQGWAVWVVFACGILLFGNLLQISSIRFLGAPMVSTMLAFRLVSAAICSALLLDENLNDPLQIIGALIVLFSVSMYMYVQYKSNKKKSAAKGMALSASMSSSTILVNTVVKPSNL